MVLKVAVGFNEREAVMGAKKISASLEQVDRDLDELGKSGGFDKLAREADQAGKKVKRNLTEPLSEVKSEAGQSGREAAASFSGGFADVGDFLQETAANAFAGFGPAGAAAGIAVAAIIGTALASATAAQEQLNEARSAAADLAQQLYENNGTLPMTDSVNELFRVLSAESRANGPLQKLLDDFMDYGTVIDDVKDSAKLARVPVSQLLDALQAGNLTETSTMLGRINDRIKELRDSRAGWVPVWDEEYQSLQSVASELERVATETELARDLAGTVGSSFDSADYVAKVESIGEAWQNAMTDAGAYISQQDGVTTFDWSGYLANAEATLAAANDYKARIVTLPSEIQEEGARIFAEQGAQAAAAYVGAFESASSADRQRFIDAAKNNGQAAGQQQGATFAAEAEAAAKAKAQGWGPLTMPVNVTVNDSAWRNWSPSAKFATVYAGAGPGIRLDG